MSLIQHGTLTELGTLRDQDTLHLKTLHGVYRIYVTVLSSQLPWSCSLISICICQFILRIHNDDIDDDKPQNGKVKNAVKRKKRLCYAFLDCTILTKCSLVACVAAAEAVAAAVARVKQILVASSCQTVKETG